MAFKDFLLKNSYSVIDNISYQKDIKNISFKLKIFVDDTKSELIQELNFNLYPNEPQIIIKHKAKNKEPKEKNIRDTYIVKSKAKNEWGQHNGSIVSWDGALWRVLSEEDLIDRIIYIENDNKYYKYINGELKNIKNIFTKELWDEFFSIEKMNSIDNNIIKAIYEYLKTRDEFKILK